MSFKGLLALALALGLLGACGGPSEVHCAAESAWSGTCTLKSLTKLREVEFPVPHAVYEALYEPQQNPSSPGFTPPAVRQELKVMSSQELELQAYLDKNKTVECHMQAPPPGACQPGPVQLALPAFEPTGATPASQVKGCAQIESQATQDRVAQLSQNTTPIPEVFSFDESSAELGPASQQSAAAVAARLGQSPGIECVAIVGQISPGEAPALANDRARAVKKILEAAGVDPSRLMTITVTQQVYGTGTAGPVADPTKRRATLKVILQH